MNNLKLVNQLGIETVCVDSENIKRKAKKIGISFIPSIIISKPRKILTKQDLKNFLKVYENEIILENDEKKNPIAIETGRTVKNNVLPPKTPIADITVGETIAGKTTLLSNGDIPKDAEDSVKKAVKDNSIMEKVKLLTKEREEVLNK
jgi:hypothetical protein